MEANEIPTILVDETDDVKVIEESETDTSSSTIIELTPKQAKNSRF